MGNELPSMDAWLKEAKAHPSASRVGMYLTHNGVVRADAKAKVRQGAGDTRPVTGMYFDYDPEKVEAIIAETYQMQGIYYIRVWLNRGQLTVGDDIMYVLSAVISGPGWWTPCNIWSGASKANVL